MSWGLQRVVVALVGAAFIAVFAYAVLVFGMVAVQAIASFGQ